MAADELLTIEEVIAELRIPRSTFYRWRWPSVSLSRCELAKATVRPGGVVVP